MEIALFLEPSKGMVKPRLAMTKLKLIKPKAAMPRHPMPYAARNMFYDERWIEKQERGMLYFNCIF